MLRLLASKIYDLRFELLRFAISGGISTLLYGVLAFALEKITELSPLSIHFIAFFLCLPVSYMLQRVFTFSFKGSVSRSAFKFVVLSALSMVVGAGIVALVSFLGYAPYWGTLAVMVAIPSTSYITMKIWVYRKEPYIS